MNKRLVSILAVAFLLSLGASFVVYRVVGKALHGKAKAPAAQVVIAARDLQIGTLIKAGDLKMGEVEQPPKDAVASKEAVVGRGVVSTLYAGEVVMEKRLAIAGSGGGLAAMIPTGMRACAVKVDEVVGVAGFVLPGMRVDVVVSGNDAPGGQPNASNIKSKTLLQNLEVLSAGANLQKDNEGKPVQVPVVNLLVTPPQAEILSLASNQTKIQLVLRNPLDTNVSETPGTAMAGLFGAPLEPKSEAPRVVHVKPAAKTPAPVVAPAAWVVEVINGSKATKQNF